MTISLTPPGIHSTVVFGSPRVNNLNAISPSGFLSATAFGVPSLSQQIPQPNSQLDDKLPYLWINTAEEKQFYLYLTSLIAELKRKDEALVFVSGSPNGVVSAPPGTIALNKNGGAGNSLWVKEVGVDANGWVAK